MEDSEAVERARINSETAKIPFHELQRFFAQGKAVAVDGSLDLVEVAWSFSQDDKATVENWMSAGAVGVVSDIQAAEWLANEVLVWAVVVRPWILVQLATEAEQA